MYLFVFFRVTSAYLAQSVSDLIIQAQTFFRTALTAVSSCVS